MLLSKYSGSESIAYAIMPVLEAHDATDDVKIMNDLIDEAGDPSVAAECGVMALIWYRIDPAEVPEGLQDALEAVPYLSDQARDWKAYVKQWDADHAHG